jgi:hypothetical protein
MCWYRGSLYLQQYKLGINPQVRYCTISIVRGRVEAPASKQLKFANERSCRRTMQEPRMHSRLTARAGAAETCCRNCRKFANKTVFISVVSSLQLWVNGGENTEATRRFHCCTTEDTSLGSLLLLPHAEGTAVDASLGAVTVCDNSAVGNASLVLLTGPLGEAPLLGDDDQLTAGEL